MTSFLGYIFLYIIKLLMWTIHRRPAAAQIKMVEENKEKQRDSKNIEPAKKIYKACDVNKTWVDVRGRKWLIVELAAKGLTKEERAGRKVSRINFWVLRRRCQRSLYISQVLYLHGGKSTKNERQTEEHLTIIFSRRRFLQSRFASL